MSDLRNYSADAKLHDGTSIHIRAIRPDDKERLRDHGAHLSSRSVYFRFLGPKKKLSESDLALFTELDFEKRVGLVATLGHGAEEHIIGVGRYADLETEAGAPRSAELAFSVVDQYQHRGIGILLLRHLVQIARQQGIHQLEAEVFADNKAMLGVIQAAGVIARKTISAGLVHVVFSTDETAAKSEN